MREYMPEVGRFTSPDPLGSPFTAADSGQCMYFTDPDLYGYCSDDPVNVTDKTGMWSFAKMFNSNDTQTPYENGANYDTAKEKPIDNGNNLKHYIKKATGFDRAVEIAGEELSKRGKGNHNNEGDAMRHAEWSRRMTEEIGPFRAWTYGTAHEIEGLIDGQPLNEAVMDIHNNAEGRAAGKGKRPVNRKNLQKSLKGTYNINPYND